MLSTGTPNVRTAMERGTIISLLMWKFDHRISIDRRKTEFRAAGNFIAENEFSENFLPGCGRRYSFEYRVKSSKYAVVNRLGRENESLYREK
jgi:hypothetical protein